MGSLSYGNHSTVNALGGDDIISVNGGRHDNGIWIGDEDNLVYAGEGNDSVSAYSRGVSMYGGAGNDTLNAKRDHGYANGGEGNDILYFTDQYVDKPIYRLKVSSFVSSQKIIIGFIVIFLSENCWIKHLKGTTSPKLG